MKPEIRKVLSVIERIRMEGGEPVASGESVKVAVGAVCRNPYAGKFVRDLTPLYDLGDELGDHLTREALRALDGTPVESFGKAAIVGLDGEVEHAAAILHTKMGLRMRALIGGGKAIIPSTAKRAAAGTAIDIPIHYKDAACLMSHFDTLEFVIPDAPRPDEIVIVVAYGVGPRPQARIIGLPKDQIQGEDRYAYTGGLVYTKRAPDGSATSA